MRRRAAALVVRPDLVAVRQIGIGLALPAGGKVEGLAGLLLRGRLGAPGGEDARLGADLPGVGAALGVDRDDGGWLSGFAHAHFIR